HNSSAQYLPLDAGLQSTSQINCSAASTSALTTTRPGSDVSCFNNISSILVIPRENTGNGSASFHDTCGGGTSRTSHTSPCSGSPNFSGAGGDSVAINSTISAEAAALTRRCRGRRPAALTHEGSLSYFTRGRSDEELHEEDVRMDLIHTAPDGIRARTTRRMSSHRLGRQLLVNSNRGRCKSSCTTFHSLSPPNTTLSPSTDRQGKDGRGDSIENMEELHGSYGANASGVPTSRRSDMMGEDGEHFYPPPRSKVELGGYDSLFLEQVALHQQQVRSYLESTNQIPENKQMHWLPEMRIVPDHTYVQFQMSPI
ncbi:unnamed protein product, partial [Amoebophrya sp. A120]